MHHSPHIISEEEMDEMARYSVMADFLRMLGEMERAAQPGEINEHLTTFDEIVDRIGSLQQKAERYHSGVMALAALRGNA